MDCDKTPNGTSGRETSPEAYNEPSGRIGTGRPNLSVVMIICGAGLWCLARALLGGELEWRLVAMIALAAALTPMRASLQASPSRSIEFSLSHPMLFSCALALGPFDAALPAAFSGIARLVAAGPRQRPLHTVLYTVLKPAVVCCTSAAVYAAMGGSVMRPHAIDSLPPVLVSGLTYALTGALLVGLVEEPDRRAAPGRPDFLQTTAAWGVCLLAGYATAVLYAIAPAYVLLATAAAAGLLQGAIRGSVGAKHSEARPCEQTERPSSECFAITQRDDEDTAFVDHATGLANRRYVDMFLKREISRADRLARPLAAAVFDLDDSRKLAEVSDPEALEGVLREIGARLKSELRDYDVIARYSSGRLLVILPESTPEQALEVVERLHESLGSLRMGKQAVSVSVGLAAFPEDAADADGLVNSAHRALNSGRFAGPGRVSTCEELDKAS